jgi:hypothetical protein
MPCGRKRPFMVTVFETVNFPNVTMDMVTGSNNTRADVYDVQTIHNLRVSNTDYPNEMHEMLSEHTGADLHPTQLQVCYKEEY